MATVITAARAIPDREPFVTWWLPSLLVASAVEEILIGISALQMVWISRENGQTPTYKGLMTYFIFISGTCQVH